MSEPEQSRTPGTMPTLQRTVARVVESQQMGARETRRRGSCARINTAGVFLSGAASPSPPSPTAHSALACKLCAISPCVSKTLTPALPLSDARYDPLIQPALIRHEIKTSQNAQATITRARWDASRIIAGEDDRIIVVVGPCSIHSPEQALEYAKMLKEDIPKWDGLLIIMRAYL